MKNFMLLFGALAMLLVLKSAQADINVAPLERVEFSILKHCRTNEVSIAMVQTFITDKNYFLASGDKELKNLKFVNDQEIHLVDGKTSVRIGQLAEKFPGDCGYHFRSDLVLDSRFESYLDASKFKKVCGDADIDFKGSKRNVEKTGLIIVDHQTEKAVKALKLFRSEYEGECISPLTIGSGILFNIVLLPLYIFAILGF